MRYFTSFCTIFFAVIFWNFWQKWFFFGDFLIHHVALIESDINDHNGNVFCVSGCLWLKLRTRNTSNEPPWGTQGATILPLLEGGTRGRGPRNSGCYHLANHLPTPGTCETLDSYVTGVIRMNYIKLHKIMINYWSKLPIKPKNGMKNTKLEFFKR